VDDTGTRHGATNGVCTQIGNQDFAWFGTTTTKSRLNFLGLPRRSNTSNTSRMISRTRSSGSRQTSPDGRLR
jgi:hypothetical protein